ncbi:hypothetical protein CVV68_14100 [Arthrobacter livingstonensis]|uniref:Uncharacterized protein n=1 Tax=Arthrobacter livingstonensis TaxID=670078 RepID=A0A2V5L9P9_9MICC|nr:hypothetical protein CVV68_14100 [Arthrobacter livingstonensis]
MVLIVISAFILLALLQVFGSGTSKSVTANGMTVTVDYPRAARAGMPDSVVIHLRDGLPLGEPVTISIPEEYLDTFSVGDISPAAASESYSDGYLRLEYDPPNTAEFTLNLRGDWETGNDTGASGKVQVATGGHTIATIPLKTWLVL